MCNRERMGDLDGSGDVPKCRCVDGYKEEGDADSVFLSRLYCSATGRVPSMSDFCPAAISFCCCRCCSCRLGPVVPLTSKKVREKSRECYDMTTATIASGPHTPLLQSFGD